MATNSSTLSPEYLTADQGPALHSLVIVLFTLATVAVSLRFLSRIVIKAPIWWDDYVILLALILSVGPFALTLYLVQHGFGKHAEVAGLPAVLTFYKCLYAFEIVYPLPIAATKFSILFYYSRIFAVRSFRWPPRIVAGLIGCWVIYVEGAAIFTCVPVRATWDPTVTGRCIDIQKFFIGIAVPNIVTDVALLTMPLPYLWKLQLAIPKKIAIMFVFMLGGFVTVVSIIRLTVLLSLDNDDVTWIYVPTCVWTNIEVMIGIVSASVPAFWPLLRAIVTGSVRSASTRNASVVMVPSHSHKQAKQFIGRRKIGDDEEGFFNLENMAAEGPGQTKGARIEERKSGPPVPPKPCAIARIQAWRG